MGDHVTLKQLAEELDIDRSNARKFILALGITPAKIRTQDSRQQLTLAVTPEEADRIRAARKAAGFNVREPDEILMEEEERADSVIVRDAKIIAEAIREGLGEIAAALRGRGND